MKNRTKRIIALNSEEDTAEVQESPIDVPVPEVAQDIVEEELPAAEEVEEKNPKKKKGWF